MSGDEKIAMLREHLLEGAKVSDLCQHREVEPSLFYRWQKQLFENGASVLERGEGKMVKGASNTEQRKYEEKLKALEEKLQRKDAVIAALVEENVSLKKKNGEH